MNAASGRFVWFDLMTTDIQAAKSFYSEIVGWQTTKWSGGDYEMWKAGDEEVGGVMALTSDARQSGSPPQWLAYVGTNDVDSTVRKAQALGGQVVTPARDISNVGRFALLADPQGAAFAIFQALGQESATPDATKLGHFGWAELNTTDWKSAWKFYSDLFGWQHTSSMDMGPEYGEYFMFGSDSNQAFGGMSNTASMMNARPHWLYYVNVKNADDTARKIVEKGGKDVNGPMDVPGGGRIAQAVDPQGARFAIFAPAEQ
ncbi:MAG: VOC family protein [Deltaproteobacteria bacterium]|nr:VOC family protein [Deltaproteobacteria bacterium]